MNSFGTSILDPTTHSRQSTIKSEAGASEDALSFETFTTSEEEEYEEIVKQEPRERQRRKANTFNEINLPTFAIPPQTRSQIVQDNIGKNTWKDKIEFFERMKKIVPEKRKMLDKVGKGMGKLKDVALLRGSKIKVRADDERSDEIGTPTFFGTVSKRLADTNKFHARWMVLRGLDLYWYRNVGDDAQKGIMQLPGKEVGEEMVGDKQCFTLEKDEDVPNSRRLVFLHDDDNVTMREFRT